MKTKIRSLRAAAVVLAAFVSGATVARANHPEACAPGFHGGPIGAALHYAPRVFPGFARGWAPRDIRAVPLFPFATVCPEPACSPGYGAAPIYYSIAPRPESVITITIPVSAVRELLASGAIKLAK